jgi:hypothetical protein
MLNNTIKMNTMKLITLLDEIMDENSKKNEDNDINNNIFDKDPIDTIVNIMLNSSICNNIERLNDLLLNKDNITFTYTSDPIDDTELFDPLYYKSIFKILDRDKNNIISADDMCNFFIVAKKANFIIDKYIIMNISILLKKNIVIDYSTFISNVIQI